MSKNLFNASNRVGRPTKYKEARNVSIKIDSSIYDKLQIAVSIDKVRGNSSQTISG